MKILVRYKSFYYDHDCWGRVESNYRVKTEEFENMDAWLKFKSDKDVEFIEAWEIGKHII